MQFRTRRKYSIRISIIFAMLLAGIVIGAFLDLPVSRALFKLNDPFWVAVSTVGACPAFGSVILFCGILMERAEHSFLEGSKKGWAKAGCVFFGFVFSVFVGAAIATDDGLGLMYPALKTPLWVLVFGLALGVPLFWLGYRTGLKNHDDKLHRRLINLTVSMLISFIVVEVLKISWCRPRFRTVVQDYPGIPFCPFYRFFPYAAEAMAKYGLPANEFKSFPSGHGLTSVACAYIFPTLAYVFPKLKGKENRLFIAGLVYGFVVMFSRIRLGAHFVTDVCFGGILSLIVFVVNDRLQQRITDILDMDYLTRRIEIPLAKEYISNLGYRIVEDVGEVAEKGSALYRYDSHYGEIFEQDPEPEMVRDFLKMELRSIRKNALIYTDGTGYAVWTPFGYNGTSFTKLLVNGGFSFIFHYGFGPVKKFLKYEEKAIRRKIGFTGGYDWYLKCIFSKTKEDADVLLEPMVRFCDTEKMPWYTEHTPEILANMADSKEVE